MHIARFSLQTLFEMKVQKHNKMSEAAFQFLKDRYKTNEVSSVV